MSFRKSFRNTRRSGRFNPDAESRGSTPEKYGRGGAPLPFRPPTRNQHFDPKEFIVAECTERDIEVYKQIFDFFDTDDDGMLTPMDLRKVASIFDAGYDAVWRIQVPEGFCVSSLRHLRY